MPPPRTKPRWPSTEQMRRRRQYRDGYVEEARSKEKPGPCLLRYRDFSKTLSSYYFVEKNEAEVLNELDEWIDDIRAGRVVPKSRGSKVGPSSNVTLSPGGATYKEAFDIFDDAKLKSGSRENRLILIRAFKTIFGEGDDWVLTSEQLRIRLGAWLARPIGLRHIPNSPHRILDPGTVAGYMRHVTRFVRYCLASNWITVDPLPLLTYPRPTQKSAADRQVYSYDEERRIREWYAARDLHDENDLWTLLANTGMRIGEARSLHWKTDNPEAISHISDVGIHLRDTKTGVNRDIPYRVLPAVAEMLDKRRAVSGGTGPVFPWGERTDLSWRFGECVDSLGIRRGKRPIHVWRATAAHRLIHDIRIPKDIVLEIIGHSSELYKAHYELRPSMEQITHAIELHRQMIEGDLSSQSSHDTLTITETRLARSGPSKRTRTKTER